MVVTSSPILNISNSWHQGAQIGDSNRGPRAEGCFCRQPARGAEADHGPEEGRRGGDHQGRDDLDGDEIGAARKLGLGRTLVKNSFFGHGKFGQLNGRRVRIPTSELFLF